MILENIEFYVRGRFLKTAGIINEWVDDIEDPESIIGELKLRNIRTDLFTFWQRFPDTKPKFPYHMEWDNWAVLPITSYEDWFNHKVNRHARKAIRKATKMGVEVKISPLNDEFISGVTKIFNETPFRQGRRFAHYGKIFQQVKEELSNESARTDFIGAYYQGEMIGFTQQVYAKDCAIPFGGVSLIAHRDKSPNNVMLAKAVEACSGRGVRYLVYGNFDYGTGGGGLAEFKIHNGFQKMLVPRYYVPLTFRGRISLKLKLHHGLKRAIPKELLKVLVDMRKKRHAKRLQD
jgi:hypothetical protein